MYRWREPSRKHDSIDVKIPKTMEKVIETIESDPIIAEKLSIDGEKFIHTVPCSDKKKAGLSFALCSSKILKETAKLGGEYFVDGTFKIFPCFIFQLLIINALIGDHVSFSIDLNTS